MTTTNAMTPFQAGGNMGGDCDQNGRPVRDGMWYVERDGACIAGPFATRLAATAWIVKAR